LKSAAALAKAAEPWRPWRAYGAMHLWESLAPPSTPTRRRSVTRTVKAPLT
jgi:3-methyladenine DNA glycosylase/8-oxoguanine DNA glycosylase